MRGWLIKKHFMWLDDTSDVTLNRKQRRALRRWYNKFESVSKEKST